ncbi:hypothetical protein EAI_01736 [Harpegnathos saltator]|uniref:Uncharacterized protein n=1 Tax=Harpegnathos saltator TaxID=610380 RepID=E2B487_HARSA|nr:hypothetical protein EAI_01736 [Harpegnathos saltator]
MVLLAAAGGATVQTRASCAASKTAVSWRKRTNSVRAQQHHRQLCGRSTLGPTAVQQENETEGIIMSSLTEIADEKSSYDRRLHAHVPAQGHVTLAARKMAGAHGSMCVRDVVLSFAMMNGTDQWIMATSGPQAEKRTPAMYTSEGACVVHNGGGDGGGAACLAAPADPSVNHSQ